MPSTFTHPLAVLPFRRLCRAPLNFAALAIGSMSPDFGYYLHQFPAARFAHTVAGTLAVCLPSGLVVLALFYLLRQPLCFVLPQPHRGALMPLASARPSLSVRWFLVAAASILLGAWTHTVWDSFTHEGGWSVERLPFLREPLFHIRGAEFPVFYVLQQLSTFAGGAALVVAYFIWLRSHRAASSESGAFSEGQRYLLLFVLVATALVAAIPAASSMASRFHGYLAFRVFVFRAGVYAAATFIPLVVLSSCILYRACRRNS